MVLSQLFATNIVSGANEFEQPPSTIPAGFDSVMQFSSPFLRRALTFSLAQRGVNQLSVRVPYQSDLVPPGLQEAIQPHIRPLDSARGGLFVELQIIEPTLQTLHWPSHARAERLVDVGWVMQLNLFTPSMQVKSTGNAEGTVSGGTGEGNLPSVRPPTASNVTPVGFTEGSPSGALPDGDRVSLAVGTALMQVGAELVVVSSVLQFWLALTFEGVRPAYDSADPILSEFSQTDYAASLLAQAVAPLLNQSDVRLSPTAALAGSLTPNQLLHLQLPTLNVHDLVVQDDKGQVLTFCVSLGDDAGGVDGMVRSFLAGQDFAYYVSDRVVTPVLAGLWHANAIYTPSWATYPSICQPTRRRIKRGRVKHGFR